MGSLPTFAAFAHETNVKLEGEWRQCGLSCRWDFSRRSRYSSCHEPECKEKGGQKPPSQIYLSKP
jgi:hypothetical protein